METYMQLWQYLAEFFLEWNVSETRRRKNENVFWIQCSIPDDHTAYEVKWKNLVEPGRPQMTE
jgi:hypothetical protein